VLSEFQQLAVGDVIPIGAGGGFPVKVIEPFRTLLLAGHAEEVRWAWQFGLFSSRRTAYEADFAHSVRFPQFPRSLKSAAFLLMIEPAVFITTRKMLLGIKRRAETLSQNSREPKRAASTRFFMSASLQKASRPPNADSLCFKRLASGSE
jgi:hypothetical protein